MNPRKRTTTSERLLEILKERSKNGLEFARKVILAERIESKKTREALEYYTSNWKIFIHPGLFSIACEAVGGNPDNTVPIQACLSMLAAAFDIHDDVIDNSRIKQGRPTIFGKFGKGMAILLGDAFLIGGFTLLSESNKEMPQERIEDVIETLEKALFELGNAHALELNLKGRIDITPEEYMQILRMKAASATADMQIGGIVGGGSDNEVQALTTYGRNIGILTTLREEFVDTYELEEFHQRVKNEYLPIPILCAFQNATAKRKIQNILSQRRLTMKHIEEITRTAFQTKDTKKLRDYMKKLKNEAVSDIINLRRSPAKLTLRNLANAMLEEL